MKKDAQRAKVFWTGRSQAVRLPKGFRLDVESVLIRREGNTLVLEPVHDWPEGFIEWLRTGPLPKDFRRQPQGENTPVPALDEGLES